MASGALDQEHLFVEVGWSFLGALLVSHAQRGMGPGAVLGDVIAWTSFTWLLSLTTWGQLQIGRPAACTVLLPMDEKLGCKAVIPRSEKEGTKPPYVCPGCSNHTHGNNMINRCNVIK
jgi:hypothetical protein